MFKMLMTGAAAALALAAAPAHAEPQYTSVNVSYNDLNLASGIGQKRLARRVDSAARKVCGHYAASRVGLTERTRSTACYKKAKADALPRVAMLVERYAKGG